MKRLLLILLAGGFLFFTNAYETDPTDELIWTYMEGNTDWMRIKEGVVISADDLLRDFGKDLGLSDADEMRLFRTDHDDLGFTHHRYQQFYKNVPIEGGELLIHEVGGQVKTLNGKIFQGINTNTIPSITGEEAIESVLNSLNAGQYLWESKLAQEMMRAVLDDPDATFYPQAELVLVDPTFEVIAENVKLAYKFEVRAQIPLIHGLYFVDAVTGEILQDINQLHATDTPALGKTRYDGERQIVTDSIASDTFRLYEEGRGGGIFTFDLQMTTNVDNAIDYIDADNYWENNDSTDIESAISAHWGAEQTFDYLVEKHDYIGVDNDSMPLISMVNYGQSVVNAFWNGMWATFGNGDGARTALTSLDVVGHEFTHGITRSTANLLYYKEAGALNESFSDIFGEAVEDYAKEEGTDWLIGGDFHTASGAAFRDMSDPNAEGHPDTYLGDLWTNTSGDNFGVHSNSGVQNFWFYLLTTGGTGTNDNGDDYEVNALGIDVAGDIAFRNLQFYLVRLSQHRDARMGALVAAEDIHGLCSAELEETARAWHAVGVGMPIRDNDIQPLSLEGLSEFECGIVDSAYLTVEFRYNGCAVDIEAGSELPFAYRVNGTNLVEDTLILAESLSSGETVSVEIGPITEFAAAQEHKILVWSAFQGDTENNNDTIRLDMINVGEDSRDIQLKRVENPASACLLGVENVGLVVEYLGCDELPVNSMIQVGFQLENGVTVTDSLTTTEPLAYGDEMEYTFDEIFLDFSEKGRYSFDAWATFTEDGQTANDTLYDFMLTHAEELTVSESIDFEHGDAELDSFWISANRFADVDIIPGEGLNGGSAVRLTGTNFVDNVAYESWPYERENRLFNIFEDYGAKFCFCADLTNFNVAVLRFDIKQTISPYHTEVKGIDGSLFGSLRLSVDGSDDGPVYNATAGANPSYSNKVLIMNQYIGSTVEICFESRNAMHPDADPFGVGDNAFLDNILLTGLVTSTNNPIPFEGDISLYPNPNNGSFQLAVDAPKAGWSIIQLYNTIGQKVWEQTANVGAGKQQFDMALKDLPKGIYTLQFLMGGQRWTSKMVISN